MSSVSISKIMIAVLFVAVFSGCDQDLLGEKADERQRLQREAEELSKLEQEKVEMSEGMSKAVVQKKRDLEAALKDAQKENESNGKDFEAVAKAISDAMTEGDGEKQKHEVKVLRAIKHPAVNELATRILGKDFSFEVSEFTDRIRKARQEEGRYRKAIQEADNEYHKAVNDAGGWAQATKEQRAAEIKRLKSEISRLESRRDAARKDIKNLTRHTIVGRVDQAGARQEAETRFRDLEWDINKKKGQLDYLLHPNQVTASQASAAQKTQDAIRRAQYDHENRLRDIERTMKPAKSVVDITAEFENKTLGELRGRVNAARDESDKKVDEIKKKITRLNEIASVIPISSLNELQKLRLEFLAL